MHGFKKLVEEKPNEDFEEVLVLPTEVGYPRANQLL
jgi:hypothetical protein